MKRITTSLFAALSLAAAAAFPSYADTTVSTDGSTSMEKVIGSLGEAFTELHDDISFTYNPTGSSAGISAVLEGRTDIGLSSRALNGAETENLNETVLALDGIVVIVNPQNSVDNLSTDVIAKLFTGEITNWKQAGGSDGPVVLIGREAGSGTRDGFESVTGTQGLCRYRQELTSTGDVITSVSQNPNAVGYASLAAVSDKVKAVAVNGVKASSETIQSSEYPLQRPFVLVTLKDKPLSKSAQSFLDFALSAQAGPIIEKAGAIPVGKGQ